MRSVIATAFVACCLAVPLHAQRGGGHASGGFHGGSGFSGGGMHTASRPSGASFGRGVSRPAYGGYAPGARPGFASARYGAPGRMRAANGAPGLRRTLTAAPSRVPAARPAFYNRSASTLRAGYGYGRGSAYGRRYPYRGYGYPFFPYFGVGYSPLFLPGFLAWDLDWETLGWDSPDWDNSWSYNSGYDPGPATSSYPQGSYPQYPQPAYSDNAQAAPAPGMDDDSRPSPLLPEMGPPESSPSREQVTTLIYKDGRPPEQIRDYAMTRSAVFVTGERTREIPLDQLDLPATEQVNRQAGVDFRVP